MNKSDNLLQQLHHFFPVEKKDIRGYAPLKLAYLGDAVFEILIRTLVLEHANGRVSSLHKKTSSLVNARTQAEFANAMREEFTEEEETAYRHGRNAKSPSVPKNANILDYRNATGLEALFGYLYLTGRTDRAIELLYNSLEKLDITF